MTWTELFSTGGVVSATDPAAQAGVDVADIAEIDAATPASYGAAPTVSGTSPNWWTHGLNKALPQIMGTAMKMKTPDARASGAGGGGRGVPTSSAGVMEPAKAVSKMANNNPLSDLNQWTKLF